MPKPIAQWSPARSAWETEDVSLCGHSDVFSETWPSSGMNAAWTGVRAADVGAPHGRFRIFVLAWPADASGEGLEAGREGRDGGGAAAELGGRAPGLTLLPTPLAQLAVNGGSQHPDKRRAGGHSPTLADEVEHILPTPRVSMSHGAGDLSNRRASTRLESAVLLPTPAAQEPGGTAEQYHARLAAHDGRESSFLPLSMAVQESGRFGQYALAIARWESVLGRSAPAPTEPTGKGGAHRLSPRFVEWLMGLPDGWVTDTDTTRNEQLKALGNGVVPQQAAAALRHLLTVRAAALAGMEVSA